MSKSLGNSPDPIELINKYGADGVRVGLLLTSPAGNDLPFDESICEQGRNFANKIWNALKLVKGWEVAEDLAQPSTAAVAGRWFKNRFKQEALVMEDHYSKYRLNDALMSVYKLVWDDFCSWYLEMIKPAYGSPIDAVTYKQACKFFEDLMTVLHPFMPFLTEEIWHELGERGEEDLLMNKTFSVDGSAADVSLLDGFARAVEVIMVIRALRNEKNIPQKTMLRIVVKRSPDNDITFDKIVEKLCNLQALEYIDEQPAGTLSFRVGKSEYFLFDEGVIDRKKALEEAEKDLKYNEGFLKSVMNKLSNEKFMAGAPEAVVAAERKKQKDAEEKIAILQAQIVNLKR
jgi:valyl-tRNA synthetase